MQYTHTHIRIHGVRRAGDAAIAWEIIIFFHFRVLFFMLMIDAHTNACIHTLALTYFTLALTSTHSHTSTHILPLISLILGEAAPQSATCSALVGTKRLTVERDRGHGMRARSESAVTY
jgi:hypothetical protein